MANTDNLEFHDGVFPSPILGNDVIKTLAYGKAVGRAIYKTAIESENSYYVSRNNSFAETRTFANGKQPFQTYLDLLMVDGKSSFLNLDYHPRPVAPKFRDILINTIMNKTERIECYSMSLETQLKKRNKKDAAAFRMANKDFINAAQQQTGMQMEQPDAFTPDSEEELNLWAELNDKEREELLMEEAVQFVNYNNDFDSIKKDIVSDIVDVGMGWGKNYFDSKGRIKEKSIRPEMMVYGTTNTYDFRHMPYMAHLERMKIVDFRAMWPKYDEEVLYDLAYSSRNKNGNSANLSDYSNDYATALSRPYDGYLIDVLFYEYRVTKYIDYTKGTDRNANPVFEFKPNTGKKANPNKKEYKANIPTIYCGAWPVGADDVAEWHEMSNLLRSNADVEEVSYSYSGYIINNKDNMLPKSPMDNMKSSIIQMDLAILKMQQHLAMAAPDGMNIDIDSITDIDLGSGVGKVGALKLREIRLQTGDTYWSSAKMSGERNQMPPIQDAIHSLGDKLQQFIGVYNFELGCIRDYIGVNELRDGSNTPDRLGLQVMQTQIQASNTATQHIYDAFVSIMGNMAKKTIIMLWQVLKFGNPNSMYMKILGAQNIDFIKEKELLTANNYSTMVTVDMSMDDKQFLAQNITFALQQGTIELQDAIYVRKVPDLDLAMRYLAFVQKKRAKEKNDAELQKQQQGIQQQGQQAQTLMQQKSQDQQAADQLELQKVQAKSELDQKNKVQDAILQANIVQMQTGAEIPPYIQMLMAAQMKDMQEQQLEHEQQMDAQEQQMRQQQSSGIPDDSGQPQPQEQQPEAQEAA
jgi:hypothetical protein